MTTIHLVEESQKQILIDPEVISIVSTLDYFSENTDQFFEEMSYFMIDIAEKGDDERVLLVGIESDVKILKDKLDKDIKTQIKIIHKNDDNEVEKLTPPELERN